MGRSVGPSLKATALLLIFLLLQRERWVCLEILLERGTKWGVVPRVGSDSGACSSPVPLPVVCIKTFFFSKAVTSRLGEVSNSVWPVLPV